VPLYVSGCVWLDSTVSWMTAQQLRTITTPKMIMFLIPPNPLPKLAPVPSTHRHCHCHCHCYHSLHSSSQLTHSELLYNMSESMSQQQLINAKARQDQQLVLGPKKKTYNWHGGYFILTRIRKYLKYRTFTGTWPFTDNFCHYTFKCFKHDSMPYLLVSFRK
jgi:hypothetical protein